MVTVAVPPLSIALFIVFKVGLRATGWQCRMVSILKVGIGGGECGWGELYSNLGKTWAVLDLRNVLLLLNEGRRH